MSFLAGLLAWLGIVTTHVQAAPRREAAAGAIRSGFSTGSLLATDDGSSVAVPLGFGVNFFGLNFNRLYVNNNGNVTFDAPLGVYTPRDLTSIGGQIIAPFWADVDTTGVGSAL